MTSSRQQYISEAERIGNYLLPVAIHGSEKEAYADAMLVLDIGFSNYENELWKKMIESKWKMACIDAGLALIEPSNGVRRKLFTMLAILEASPHYTTYFLPQKTSLFDFIKVVFAGSRAIWRALIGLIMVKQIKRKCR